MVCPIAEPAKAKRSGGGWMSVAAIRLRGKETSKTLASRCWAARRVWCMESRGGRQNSRHEASTLKCSQTTITQSLPSTQRSVTRNSSSITHRRKKTLMVKTAAFVTQTFCSEILKKTLTTIKRPEPSLYSSPCRSPSSSRSCKVTTLASQIE